MHFAILVLLAPVALCQNKFFNLPGTCSSSTDGVCDWTKSVKDPWVVCNGRAGAYGGDGIGGRTACTIKGSPCTYVWHCGANS